MTRTVNRSPLLSPTASGKDARRLPSVPAIHRTQSAMVSPELLPDRDPF